MSKINKNSSDQLAKVVAHLGLEHRLNPDFIKTIPGLSKNQLQQIMNEMDACKTRKELP